jgi:ubiquinone/menaquinone biosynthesis C-methylase UbiE
MNQNKFGGERLDLEGTLSKNNVLEHLARYKLVKERKENTVLDIGCGTGHGSNILSQKFEKVYGVDVSSGAIEIAKKKFHRKNITFLVGSGTEIPFKSNTFDIIVAFEVFEHIKDWKAFLLEIKRVTKKNGKIYISTPNKDIYSPGTKKPINPHHFFEMTIPQFKNALEKYFTIDVFLGQRTPVYNDHWIWNIVDPLLFTFKGIIPYKWNNTLKLQIINIIKKELDPSDIVFSDETSWVRKSRQMLAICKNNKK